MKVGLVFLPAWIPYNPPLGISCIASYIEAHDFSVEVFDYNAIIYDETKDSIGHLWLMDESTEWAEFNRFNKNVYPHIKKYLTRLVKEITKSNLDAVGFSIYNSNSHPTSIVISLLKKLMPNLKIFIGGARVEKEYATQLFNLNLIDAAIIGEGEVTTLELLNSWRNGKNPAILPGGIIQHNNEIKTGPQRPLLKIKDLPIPNFSKFELSRYTSDGFPIEFSRGCIAKCTFCSETNYWVSFRTKSASQIVNEFKFHYEEYGVNSFRVIDSLMNGNHKLLDEICDLIIQKNLHIKWYGFCRIDKKLTPDLLKKMKLAGCININFGIESGSQTVLDLMKKNYKIDIIHKNVKDTFNSGIQAHTQILIGFPGESWWNFCETLIMLFKLRNYFDRVYPGIPLQITERTEVYDNLERYNVIHNSERNWRTKDYTNTPLIRKIRHWILVKFLTIIKLEQGYPLEVK